MMTNGPEATVGEILDVGLPRPRERIAISEDDQYNHCRHEVLRFLYERHGKKEVETTTAKKTGDKGDTETEEGERPSSVVELKSADKGRNKVA